MVSLVVISHRDYQDLGGARPRSVKILAVYRRFCLPDVEIHGGDAGWGSDQMVEVFVPGVGVGVEPPPMVTG